MIIRLCPYCKEYLAVYKKYKFCCNCGMEYNVNFLIVVNTDIDEPQGQPVLRSNIPGNVTGLVSLGEVND